MDSIILNGHCFNAKEKTIMDIMGNTKDEKVCTNMLAFYFNPNEEHELNNLVLKALIDVLITKNQLKTFEDKNIAITTELKTLNGNRIDIVIKNDDCVIGIENKIDASLYNDLNDYSKTLDLISDNAIKIVLSIHEVNTNYSKTGFINITYTEFLDSLEELLKSFEYKDKKWYLYLEDFIINLRGNHIEYNLKKSLSNENLKLNHTVEYYNDEIQSKVYELIRLVKNKKIDRKAVNAVSEKNFDLTAYILLNGYNIDARLTANGWEIGVFVYKNSKVLEIKDFLNINNIQIKHESNQHLWIQHFDYNEEVEKVANYYLEIYNLVKNI